MMELNFGVYFIDKVNETASSQGRSIIFCWHSFSVSICLLPGPSCSKPNLANPGLT